jgi:hypothetical protein
MSPPLPPGTVMACPLGPIADTAASYLLTKPVSVVAGIHDSAVREVGCKKQPG